MNVMASFRLTLHISMGHFFLPDLVPKIYMKLQTVNYCGTLVMSLDKPDTCFDWDATLNIDHMTMNILTIP